MWFCSSCDVTGVAVIDRDSVCHNGDNRVFHYVGGLDIVSSLEYTGFTGPLGIPGANRDVTNWEKMEQLIGFTHAGDQGVIFKIGAK